MKKTFEEAKLQLILVGADIITTSTGEGGAGNVEEQGGGSQLP